MIGHLFARCGVDWQSCLHVPADVEAAYSQLAAHDLVRLLTHLGFDTVPLLRNVAAASATLLERVEAELKWGTVESPRNACCVITHQVPDELLATLLRNAFPLPTVATKLTEVLDEA